MHHPIADLPLIIAHLRCFSLSQSSYIDGLILHFTFLNPLLFVRAFLFFPLVLALQPCIFSSNFDEDPGFASILPATTLFVHLLGLSSFEGSLTDSYFASSPYFKFKITEYRIRNDIIQNHFKRLLLRLNQSKLHLKQNFSVFFSRIFFS